MSRPMPPELRIAVNRLRKKNNVALNDVLSFAGASLKSTQSGAGHTGTQAHRCDGEIAAYIRKLKREFSRLQAQDLHERRIPQAGAELTAVASATEDAASRIMESAETILAADPADPEAYRQTVAARATTIFEACLFQDIAGQRLAKVMETLDDIAAQLRRFSTVASGEDCGRASAGKARRRRRNPDPMLNGPALDGEGVSQSDIDRILGD